MARKKKGKGVTLTQAATKWASKSANMKQGVATAATRGPKWLQKFCKFAGAEIPDCTSRFGDSEAKFSRNVQQAAANWDTVSAPKITPDHYKDGIKSHGAPS